MSQDTTNSTESSAKKEMKTVNTEHKEIIKKMQESGFSHFDLGIQFFAAKGLERDIDNDDSSGSSSEGSEAIVYDPQEGKVANSKQYIIPIIEGPKVTVKDKNKEKAKRGGEKEGQEQEGKE